MIRQLGQAVPYRRPMRYVAPPRFPQRIARPRRALGELDYGSEFRWACCDTRADGSLWEMNIDTYEWRMVSKGTPPPSIAPVTAPVLVGIDATRGYTWQMPGGTFVTTTSDQPPTTAPTVTALPSYLQPVAAAPPPVGATIAPAPLPAGYQLPSGAVEQAQQLAYSWQAETPVALPPGISMAPESSPGILPADGLVSAPNFSDPAGTGSPYNATATTVVAGAPPSASVPASSEGSMVPWLVAAALGFFALRGGG